MRAEMIRLHMPHDAPPGLIGIDVQRVQILADVAQRGELLRRVRQRGLDSEVEEPGVDARGGRVVENVGEEARDEWVHD